jgi:hypothetical protein
MKLTQEEKDTLSDLMVSDYWPVIMKAIAMGVERARENFVGQGLTTEADQFILAAMKFRLEGAQGLEAFMFNLKRSQQKREKNNAKE